MCDPSDRFHPCRCLVMSVSIGVKYKYLFSGSAFRSESSRRHSFTSSALSMADWTKGILSVVLEAWSMSSTIRIESIRICSPNEYL